MAALAAAGLVVGRGVRAVIARLAIPAGVPPAGAPPASASPADALPAAASPASASPAGALPAAAPPAGDPPAGQGPARTGPPPLTAELVTAALFGGLAARVHPGLVLAAACWLAACCVALAWIDAVVQRLPDALTGAAYAGTAGLLLAAAAAGGRWPDLLRAVLGGLLLAAAYLALAVISRSALGLGDVKLAASLGTLTAWAGWPVLIGGAFAGFLLGALYGGALLVTRRAHLRQRIPFGPFMIAGAFLAVLASGL